MPTADLETLEAAARARWGDEWTIRTQHFADGTSDAVAFHVVGHPEQGTTERERLFVGADGDVYHDRVVVEDERIVDVVERDEAPADVASEIVSDEDRTMTVTREGGSWRVFLPDEDVEKLHLSLDEGRVLAYAGDRVLAFETVQSRTLPIGGDDA